MTKTPKFEIGIKDGTVPASGEVGEYIYATCSSATTSVTANALIPAGFRPSRRHLVPITEVIAGGVVAMILRVDVDGAINFYSPSFTNILNGQVVQSAGSGSDYASFSFQADAT